MSTLAWCTRQGVLIARISKWTSCPSSRPKCYAAVLKRTPPTGPKCRFAAHLPWHAHTIPQCSGAMLQWSIRAAACSIWGGANVLHAG